MMRQNLTPILKRSIQCRRCIFRQQHGTTSKQSPLLSEPRTFVRSSVSRVSSTTTTANCNSTLAQSASTNLNSSSGVLSFARQAIQSRKLPGISPDAVREALPFIGNGAYMALASGFLMTDMLQLRLMLVGGYAGLVTFHSLHARPLQIPLRWSALFVLVNAGAAVLLFVDQWIGALLSDEELAFYEEHFSDGLTPGQFYYLKQLATTKEVRDGSILTREGCVSPHLYFIEKGQARVYHRGTFASYVDEGGFVNDVAFQQTKDSNDSSSNTISHVRISESGDSSSNNNITNEQQSPHSDGVGAYGTVIANGDCKVWVWDQAQLKEYLANRPEMDRNMKYTLSQHLVRSLLKQREVRRRASTEEQDVLEKTELTMPQRREFRRIQTSNWP